MNRFLAPGRRRVRDLLDRAARPYLDEIQTAISAQSRNADPIDDSTPSIVFGGVPSDMFHHINHELRTVELELLPRGIRDLVSIGANGRWYFDWVEGALGTLDWHIAIESYESRPNDLPANVVWLEQTADDMSQVGESSVDLVFAGQTTEHLWADQLTGFLLEAGRVLRPGGMLALDSPNRLVTEYLHWSHGEHTVELAASEIEELLVLAGFDVQSVRGIWRCRFGDRVLALEEELSNGATLVRRVADGPSHPNESFIWWVNAVRGARDPAPADLSQRVESLYRQHWPRRVSRGLSVHPDDAELVLVATQQAMTLPFPLHAGNWVLVLEFVRGTPADAEGLTVRVLAPGGSVVQRLSADTAEIRDRRVTWTFEIPSLMFALVLAIDVTKVNAECAVRLPLAPEPS